MAEATAEEYQRVFLQTDAGRKVLAEILIELGYFYPAMQDDLPKTTVELARREAQSDVARFILYRCGILKADAIAEVLKKWYEVATAERIANAEE